MKYGYVRVSTKEQHIDRQLKAMREEGIKKDYIFIDTASGKDFERASYQKLLETVVAGDELVIKSIDRLGRNYEEIIEQWRMLVKNKKVQIKVLDFPLLNTSNRADNLTGQLIADLVLQILSYVSQLEREQIRQRQKEGILVAQKKGVRFGRPKMDIPTNFYTLADRCRSGHLTVRQGAKLLGVSKSTFQNWLKTEKKRNKRT